MRVETNSFNPVDIAISGMRGQGKRMEDISSGVANLGKGGQSGGSRNNTGIGLTGGAQAMSMDDLPNQMINLNKATRAYKANVAVLKRYEQMINTTLELLR